MSDQKFETCLCNICSGRIEFDVTQVGASVMCPHCHLETILFIPGPQQQAEPMPTPNAPLQSDVPRPSKPPRKITKVGWLVRVLVLAVVVVLSGKFLWGIHQTNKVLDELEPKPETEAQRSQRLKAEAEFELLSRCTNEVTGFSRVVSKQIYDADPNPNKWTATATVEFENHIGGIDRTNLPFTFWQSDGHISCMLDVGELAKQDYKSFERELGKIREGNE